MKIIISSFHPVPVIYTFVFRWCWCWLRFRTESLKPKTTIAKLLRSADANCEFSRNFTFNGFALSSGGAPRIMAATPGRKHQAQVRLHSFIKIVLFGGVILATVLESAGDGGIRSHGRQRQYGEYGHGPPGPMPFYPSSSGTGWPAPPSQSGSGTGAGSTWYATWPLARTIGVRILYPGVMLSTELRKPLQADRAKQMRNLNGVRHKIRTTTGNIVDTMFFDKRRSKNPNGKTLVICFEGNAGFYENGILQTPHYMGYSVLGWNHPGFGESTGIPYPSNEMAAADAVFEYAVGMGFQEKDIVLYAWSIGGFSSSYLASIHPKIKKLILDGTFDDILPLAMSKVPKLVSGIVATTIRHHFDLRLNKLLEEYHGPLVLIRRVDDEVIATPAASLEHNRGTYLLYDIIHQRYPALFDSEYVDEKLRDWLAESHEDNERNVVEIPKQVDPHKMTDTEKARLVINIADGLLLDHKTTHSTPLPGDIFEKAMHKKIVHVKARSRSSSSKSRSRIKSITKSRRRT